MRVEVTYYYQQTAVTQYTQPTIITLAIHQDTVPVWFLRTLLYDQLDTVQAWFLNCLAPNLFDP